MKNKTLRKKKCSICGKEITTGENGALKVYYDAPERKPEYRCYKDMYKPKHK